jgi:uncharacterized protein
MTDEVLRGVFRAAREYHYAFMKRTGEVPQTTFIFHGGEPFALPLEYLERVQEIRGEILGADGRKSRYFTNAIQTNLYKLDDPIIDFLRRHRISLGVSLDLVSGVRVSVTGKETESRVLRNLDRLAENGIRAGGIVVLAKHTAPHIRRIYDTFAERGMSLRVLPLFDGPATRPSETFAADDDELARAMSELFDHWMETGCAIDVLPLRSYLRIAIRATLSMSVRPYDRRVDGDRHFLVDTDGTVQDPGNPYEPELVYGSVCQAPFTDMLRSEGHARSLRRDDARREQICGGCPYRGPCDSFSAFETKQDPRQRCGVPHFMIQHVQESLRTWGFDAAALRAMLREELGVVEGEALSASL